MFTEAFSLLPANKTLGIYYDDPESVPESDLRYAVGSIVTTEAETETMTKNGFKIAKLPRPEFVVGASFPFRTTISIYLAIFKVYPALKRYIAARGLCAYPAAELYDDHEIRFMMPLSRQEEWFVPEFADEDVSVATSEHEEQSDFEELNNE